MGHSDETTLEQAAGPLTAGIELSRLIREEVRAVVREQILASASEPAPPSYDTSSRLLTTDTASLRNDSLDGVDAALLQDSKDPKPSPPVILGRLPHWLRVAVRIVPVIAVFVRTPAIATSGRDPLLLSVAALILLLSVYGTAIIPLFVIGAATATTTGAGSEKSPKDEEQQPPKENEEKKDQDTNFLSYFTSYHFSFTYLVFGFVLWLWFVKRDDSLLATHQLAGRFDAKIDTPDALSKLTTCFYDIVPDRNVTIQDFTHCLTKLGIDPGH